MKKKEKRGPMRFRDVMEIVSGHSKENAKIPNRTDNEGNKIPNGMRLWRYRMGKRCRELN